MRDFPVGAVVGLEELDPVAVQVLAPVAEAVGQCLRRAVARGEELPVVLAGGHAERGDVLLELELEGALRVQDEVPGSVTVFIAADVDELERRLRERATESTGEIGERIALAREQLERAHEFRYMVRNDDLERATSALSALVECELALAGTMPRP